ncbi:hypothetical protein LAZ67_4000414 [Cordylochernes scorpioides]|uniref:Reverse transcriptase domain-containing protein n=1 Tax=Cordylochernes scorpioides TaxID=51811 RepID=A0ABY6KBG9_9ARAC|nr:hypothetical protein LAZ67_4000414 [Cordylochernes scorpioides]
MELPLVNVSTCELRSVIRFFTAKNETEVKIHRNLVMVWKKPEKSAPKKAKVTISTGKVMAIVFWDCKRVLLVDYLPPNTTVNATRYCEVLTKLRAAIKRKRPGLLSRKVLLVHDNARPHAARTTQTLLENFKWEIFTHPPYSLELAPSYFHLLPALKFHLGGKHFAKCRRRRTTGYEDWTRLGTTVVSKNCYNDAAKSLQGHCISRSQSGKWHKAFKEGREEVADEPRSGRPTTARTDENVDRVLEVLRTDLTEDLQMRKVCAKLVPKVLTQDQKELRVLRCQELLDLIQNEPDFLNSVVTGDESWMFEYDPESKRQSCAWHTKSSLRPKKARMSKSRIKTMIIVFFDIRGIVHCAQEIETPFARVRTDIKDTVKLHHDNATSHTAFIITNFLARSNTPVIPHPPFSPDLAPCDFFLFPRLKREMKGKYWETVDNIQHHVTTFLRSIPVEEFQGAFQAWQTRLRNHLSSQVNITEIETAIKLTKKYKAAGNDEIPAEFIIELGKSAKSWLARFFTIIMETGNIPKEWRQSKILAVLKPGKEPTCSANFRPIALLCTTHKLLERIILARLTPILDPEIPVEQAGFRGNRSCCDRVASLTSFIENGFQLGMKSAVVLLDLSSAYDTVWIDGLIYKLAKVLKCKQTLNLLSSLLSPRKFTVYLNSKSSKEYTIYNGLPQGSVLSPLLYNWYTHDIPQTTSKKFIYADDTAILAQAKTFEELEIQLNKDLETLHNYFENWSLRLNRAKSVHCCFHLNNHRAERKLKLFINNSQITHSEHPKYLGIHLDRTLTFKTHLTKLKGKLSSRNNILHKLAGSSWGSDANTLRTSALALIFSTAEYCAPVWEGSCHTKLIDTQLNSTLRIITGVCQPTRIDWLPVLAHISPPELRRKEATKKMYQKLLDSPDLEINPILQSPPKHRLKSRNPIWSRGNQLLSQNFNISEAWTNSWISSDIPNKNLITSPSVKIPGFSLPRREWVLLNRFRTGQGRCAELMKLWGYTKDPNCACNVPQSMSHILDDCPLYKFNGGISNLHSVTPEALNWLKALPLRL